MTRFERLVATGQPARGARAVARPAARRRRRRAVRRRRDPPAGGAAAGGGRARDRPRPRRRPAPRVRRRARAAGVRASRCASACTRSGCWRSTAPAARPTRSRPTATPAPCSSRRSGVEPGPGAAAPARGDPAPGRGARRDAADRPARRAGREPHRGRAPGAAAGRGRHGGQRRRAAGGARAPATDATRRRLPVQGPGVLRRRGRRVLLRARAARRRARRPPDRRPADGDRRRRRAAASRRCCAPGCSPRWRAACCPAASAGRSPCCARASTRCEELERVRRGRRRPAGDRRRPVRGALHGLPRRGRARGVRRRAVRRASAPARDRAARRPRRLLRALRGLPRARAPARRRATCSSGRCAATSCAARSSCRRERAGLRGRARARRRPARRRRGPARRAAAALHRAARAVAAARRAAAAHERLRAGRRRAGRGRAAGRARLRAARARAACGGAADPAAAGRRRGERRAPPRSAGRARTTTSEVLAVLADERLVTLGEDEVEVAHEALLREWPRLRGWLEEDAQGRRLHAHLREAARGWADGGRDPGELYRGARLAAALEWAGGARRRAQRDRARVPGREPRGEPALAAPAAGGRWPASACCSRWRSSRARSRSTSAASARAEATAAEAQRLGRARARRGRPRPLAAARAPGRRARRHAADAREPAGGAAQGPAAIGVLRGDGDRARRPRRSARTSATLAFVDTDGTLNSIDLRTRRPVGARGQLAGTSGSSTPRCRPTTCTSARTARGSRSAAGPRSSWTRRTHRVAGPTRHRRERLRLRAARSLPTAARCWPSSPTRTSAARSSASTRAPAGALGTRSRREQRARDDAGHARRPARGDEQPPTGTPWSATPRRCARCGAGPCAPRRPALSPDGRTLLVGGADGSVRFLDLGTGAVRPARDATTARWRGRRSARTGETAITAGADAGMLVWDVERASAGRRSPATPGRSPGWRSPTTARRCTRAAWTARSCLGPRGQPPARPPVRGPRQRRRPALLAAP